MNQLYKKENYIIIPVVNNFLVINTNKVFKEGHTHTRSIGVSRLLIDLAIEKKLPKNPYFVDNLIRISEDKEYIKELEEFKEDSEDIDFRKMMKHDSYRRVGRAIRRIK